MLKEKDSSFLSTLKPTDKMLYLSQHCLLVACTSISMGNPSEPYLHSLELSVDHPAMEWILDFTFSRIPSEIDMAHAVTYKKYI